MEIEIKRLDEYDRFHALAALFFYSKTIVDILRMFGMSYFPIIENNIEMVRNMIYFIFLVYIIYHIIITGTIGRKPFILIFLFSILIIHAYMSETAENVVINEFVIVFISRCLPAMLYITYVDDFSLLVKNIIKYNWITVIYAVMLFIFQRPDDYMAISFNILPFMILNYVYGMRAHKKLYLIFSIILFVEVFSLGSRGACLSGIIAIVIYEVVNTMFNKDERQSSKLVSLVAFAIVTVFIVVESEAIIGVLSTLFPDSRTIMLLERGSIGQDSERFGMWTNIIAAIKSNPLAFRGILADRAFFEYMGGVRQYTHNFCLEVLYQFGIVFGLAIIISFYISVICMIIKAAKGFNDQFILIMMIVPSTVVHLLFSSSYLNNVNFWIVIGLLFATSSGSMDFSQNFLEEEKETMEV